MMSAHFLSVPKAIARYAKLLLPFLLLTAAHRVPLIAFPKHEGQCGWVHGRFHISNGSSIRRIWVIGTTHEIALFDSDNILPKLISDRGWNDPDLFGDFKVCARESYIRGHMQHIRLVDVRDLITEDGHRL